MRKLGILLVAAAFGVGGLIAAANAEDKASDDTIKQVMKKCMKGGLCKKVANGEASDDEKKELLKCFEAMAASKPPKGDDASWKEKTGALVSAAKLAVEGDAGAAKALKAAANCKSCHNAHKPAKK